jgi:hypothetical protein
LAHKGKKLNTRQFLAENNRSIGASPVKLKHALCKVYADDGGGIHAINKALPTFAAVRWKAM